MFRQWHRLFLLGAFILSFLVALPSAWAHGGGAITVQPVVAAPGADIQLQGEGLEANSELEITLIGMGYDAVLGSVTVAADESFRQTFSLPEDASPGVYQIQAKSEDDDTYTTEITLEAKSPSAAGITQTAEPSAEPMQLARVRSPWEWAIILFGVIASAALGALLVLWK